MINNINKQLEYFRPKNAGELLDELKKGVKCEIRISSDELMSIALIWLEYGGKYKTYLSKNKGWVVYEKI